MDDQRRPAVIVSDLDIVYRVFGAKKRGSARGQGESTLVRRLRQLGGGGSVGVSEVRAVKGVSFVAYHGESIGIIGRNGSGKSTLLRAVAGLLPPTKGRVWVDGRAALLGVNAVLMSGLSGARNVLIGGQALGLSPQEVRERYQEIVDFSGIGDFIHMPMSAYSSGMAARLRFAISTAAVPDVLIVDEALATGDATFKQRSRQRIKEIRQHAGTVFLVSHSNQQIRSMCTRVLWMDDGRIIMDGPPDEVIPAYARSTGRRAGRGAGQRTGRRRAGGKRGTRPAEARAGAQRHGAEQQAGARAAASRPAAPSTPRTRRRPMRPASAPAGATPQGDRPLIAGERRKRRAQRSPHPSPTALESTSTSRPNHVPSTAAVGSRLARPAGRDEPSPDRPSVHARPR